MSLELLIATSNPGKVKEFREMLGDERFVWTDLSSHRELKRVEETGRTFLANATLKATGYARQSNRWALADDSGLEVDALDGQPGVISARFAELNNAGRGDADNNAYLLQRMKDVPDDHRAARFVCVLALSDPDGQLIATARDTVEGRMLHSPRGKSGFGYDPLFFIDSLRRTTAELAPEEKHAISHRGKALRRMRAILDRLKI